MTRRIVAAALIVGLVSPAFPASAQRAAPPAQTDTTSDPGRVKPGEYVIDSDHSKITWAVSHLGFSMYRGQITGVTGTMRIDPTTPGTTALTVSIPLRNVTSLNKELDDQLAGKDWFNVAEFPNATFQASRVEVTGLRKARILGDLTLKGVTRRIVIEARFNAAGTHPVDNRYTVGFDGRTKFKRSDFGLSTFVPAISDEVILQLEAEFKAVQ